jgi:hypothetical protein
MNIPARDGMARTLDYVGFQTPAYGLKAGRPARLAPRLIILACPAPVFIAPRRAGRFKPWFAKL